MSRHGCFIRVWWMVAHGGGGGCMICGWQIACGVRVICGWGMGRGGVTGCTISFSFFYCGSQVFVEVAGRWCRLAGQIV